MQAHHPNNLHRVLAHARSQYKTGTGHTGTLNPISKQDMETAFFGDDKKVKDKSVDAAIGIILQNGTEQRRKFQVTSDNLNPSRGGGEVHVGGTRQGGR